jgi:hypothetical protein
MIALAVPLVISGGSVGAIGVFLATRSIDLGTAPHARIPARIHVVATLTARHGVGHSHVADLIAADREP